VQITISDELLREGGKVARAPYLRTSSPTGIDPNAGPSVLPSQPVALRRSRANLVSPATTTTGPPIALKRKASLRRATTVPIAPLTASGLYGNLTLVLDPKTSAPLRPTAPPKRLLYQPPMSAQHASAPVPKMLLSDVSLDKALPAEDDVGRVTRHGNLVWTAPSVRAQYRTARSLKKKDDNNPTRGGEHA